MDCLNKEKSGKIERPIKVLQFGEGNFLRAFADYMIDIANENGKFNGDIVLVKPTESGTFERFVKQECQYTVLLRGISNKEVTETTRVVTSVTDIVSPYSDYEKYDEYAKLDTLRFVVSNTTEAGIVFDETDRFDLCPPKSFPGKLTKFLFTRFTEFNGDPDKGLVMLPVELIDDNGTELKECVLKNIANWKLPLEFKNWVEKTCIFTSTLVDRIVTGYPKDEALALYRELGYEDSLITTGEPFALWVIETPVDISKEFPLHMAGLPVVYTEDHHPYKQCKVRILNGAHTSFVLASYLCGNDTVLQSMKDELIYDFIKSTVYDEIIPTLTLNKDELKKYADDVLERFSNPYIRHLLLSISLNSVSKWKTRCMPSLVAYIEKEGSIPKHLAFSLASLMTFYTGSIIQDKALIGHRGEAEYKIIDDMEILEFFKVNSCKSVKEFVQATLSKESFWGCDLSKFDSMEELIESYIESIRSIGIRKTMEKDFIVL